MVRRRTRTRKKPASWLGEPPKKRSGAWVLLVLAGLVLVNLYVFVWDKKTSIASMRDQANQPQPMEIHGDALKENLSDSPTQPVTIERGNRPLPSPAGAANTPAVLPPGTIEGKVAKGGSIGKILKKEGLSANETDEIIRAITSAGYESKLLHAGQIYRIERGPDNHVRSFELFLAKNSSIRAEREAAGKLVGRAILPKVRIETATMSIPITKALTASVKAAGGNAQLAELLAEAFAYDLDPYNDLKEGDVFTVVVDKEIGEDNKLVRYKQLVAARFKGKVGTFDAFNWHGKMYTHDGEAVERTRVKSPFKYGKTKKGLTSLWAVADGTIIVRTGDVVIVRHEGYDTAYMRLYNPAEKQAVGQKVDAKTVIGYIEGTALEAHFGVKKDGDFIDASKMVAPRTHPVPSGERDAFRTEVGKLSTLLDACRSDASSSC